MKYAFSSSRLTLRLSFLRLPPRATHGAGHSNLLNPSPRMPLILEPLPATVTRRLFGGMPNAKADYTFVPTVVFSHPVIGTVGYTEEEAKKVFGAENLKIYNSTFYNLWYSTFYKGGEPTSGPCILFVHQLRDMSVRL